MAEPRLIASIGTAISSLSLSAKLVVLACLIIMGANSYAITAYRQAKRDRQSFGKLDYFQSFAGGVFSGCIFFLLCIFFVDDEIVAWIGAGLGAFMGFSGITKVGEMLLNAAEQRLNKS